MTCYRASLSTPPHVVVFQRFAASSPGILRGILTFQSGVCGMSDSGEGLREACCNGNVDEVQRLIKDGVNINSSNAINGWTALHWAAKRGHPQIVKILMDHGADPNLRNSKSQRPFELTSKLDIIELLGLGDHGKPTEQSPRKEKEDHGFIPNYLVNPVFPYGMASSSGDGKFSQNEVNNFSSTQKSLPVEAGLISGNCDENVPSSRLDTSFGPSPGNSPAELILKVRLENSIDNDFFETYLEGEKKTYSALLGLCCNELRVQLQMVDKIRKLPNTIIRNDRNVLHLKNYDELEVVTKTNKCS